MSAKEDVALAKAIAEKAAMRGGKTYFVGGYTRDVLMGRECRDVDIEVHCMEPENLKKLLSGFGSVVDMGQFGIAWEYRLEGHRIGVSVPRIAEREPRGETKYIAAPYIGTRRAAEQRDFTINAIMQNVLTGEILDHFKGEEDIKRKRISCVSAETFSSDPIRALRAARFASTLGFSITQKTADLCSHLDLSRLHHIRVAIELDKALLRGRQPSAFFHTLRKMSQLGYWFPEVLALVRYWQNPERHEDGDAFRHTMLVLDEAAKCRGEVVYPKQFMLAALCHDFGKPTSGGQQTTEWQMSGHAKAGVPRAERFLRRIYGNWDTFTMDYVLNMVELHPQPMRLWKSGADISEYMDMFDSAEVQWDLVTLARCNSNGKMPKEDFSEAERMLWAMMKIYGSRTAKLTIAKEDLVELGFTDDSQIKTMLSYARRLQDAGMSKEEILGRIQICFKKEEAK